MLLPIDDLPDKSSAIYYLPVHHLLVDSLPVHYSLVVYLPVIYLHDNYLPTNYMPATHFYLFIFYISLEFCFVNIYKNAFCLHALSLGY